MQHQKLLVDPHTFALPSELAEQLPQPATASHIETKRLGEILLRVCRGVRAHIIGQRRRDPAPLEIHPVLIRHAVGFPYFAKGAAESTAPRPRPMVIQE